MHGPGIRYHAVLRDCRSNMPRCPAEVMSFDQRERYQAFRLKDPKQQPNREHRECKAKKENDENL